MTGTSSPPGTIDVLVVDDDFMVARVHRTFVERVEPFTSSACIVYPVSSPSTSLQSCTSP